MNHSTKSKIEIRNYKVEDYETVRAIFANGINENFWPAWRRSWNNERTTTLIFHLSFVLSCLLVSICLSAGIGVSVLIVYEIIHLTFLYQFYNGYANLHLNTDLLDKEMIFWTTPPHFLIVATLNNSVVGIISIQKRTETIAELNRLSVSSAFRGLGIAKALTEVTLSKCKELGFQGVYLETSDVQAAASKLYEKFGFKLLSCYVPDVGYWLPIPQVCHGILIRKYQLNF